MTQENIMKTQNEVNNNKKSFRYNRPTKEQIKKRQKLREKEKSNLSSLDFFLQPLLSL